jgi:hypothetical protein
VQPENLDAQLISSSWFSAKHYIFRRRDINLHQQWAQYPQKLHAEVKGTLSEKREGGLKSGSSGAKIAVHSGSVFEAPRPSTEAAYRSGF